MSDITSSHSVHDRSREQLYDIVAGDGELTAKRHGIVELGTEYLDVRLGFVSIIDTERETFEVLVSTDEQLLATGATYDLPETYCRRCVETDSSLAVSDVPSAGWGGDPAYEEHGLDCYLGTPIHVDGDIVGTVCFADSVPREREFSSSERAFVELAARLLGRERELRKHRRELDERKQRLDSRKRDLDNSERKYESLLQTAPDAIFVAREDSGEIVEANEAAAKLAGIRADTLVGKSIFDFHPGGVDRHWAEFQRFIETSNGTMSRYSDGTHLHIEQPDGTHIPVEHSTQHVEIDGTQYVQGIIRDVTDRLEREADIERQRQQRESTERKYESLVAAAPNAILLADLERREFVEGNEAAVELTGYTQSELCGRPVEAIHPDGETERYIEVFNESMRRDETTRGELPDGSPLLVEHKDGTQIPVEISLTETTIDGRPHVLAIFRDISRRRERERELRLKNRAIDEASIGITIAEATDDQPLVYANGEFERTTGYDWADIEGQNCRFLQGERTDENALTEIQTALAEEKPVRRELLNYRKNGTPFWNDLHIAPVKDGDGTVTHFVGFQQDVTDRKRKEKLITVLNRVLRHNLRNGMSVIVNRSAQLRETLGPDHPESLDDILSRGEELTAVGEKAGDISKSITDAATVRPVDVVPMVTNVARRIDATYDRAAVSVDAPESQSVLATDSLRAALDELGTNAVEHAGQNPRVQFGVERTGDGVAIHVSDDGPGLPPEEQTVLERGYETPLEHGSGLGLWFVTWVVTGVGGRVSAAVDDGTTVTLSLPTETEGGHDHQSAIER